MEQKWFHDFTAERRIMLILGGFAVLPKRAEVNFTLNVAYFTCVYAIYIFLTIMAVVTIFLLKEVEVIVETIHTLVYLVIAILLPPARLYGDIGLKKAVSMIKQGIYCYDVKVPGETESEMKKTRVDQVRLITSVFTKIAIITVIAHVFIMPFIQFLIIKEDVVNKLVNPYLPLPIYMPFNTRSRFGYAVAFLCNGLFMVLLYTSASCFAQTYLSCLLQLIAELEVLNYSLANIEKRALLMLSRCKMEPSLANVYDRADFHQCICLCLKENFLHHQNILKLKNAVKPYVEAMNTIGLLLSSILIAAALLVFMKNPGINAALIISFTAHAGAYFQMCNLGELITNKSNEITNALYSTPWYDCDQVYRRLLNIGITNARRPIIMKTTVLNISSSLNTFADIVTSGYKLLSVMSS